MKKINLIFAFLLLSVSVSFAQQRIAKPLFENKIELFPLNDVQITEGQFKQIQDLDHQYLLTLEPDRMLSWFRREAGLTPKAQPYPYWESENVWGGGPLAGHILGFYMSSMSMMYQTTNDPMILERLNYVIKELKQCQEAQGDGYLLATINGKHVFEDVIDGEFTTNNPCINTTWEPIYIMNKIMLGLYGIYTRCNIQDAKSILINMANWFGNEVLDKLDHDNIQKLLVCEHGSINESYINVYEITGDSKYLEWAKKLNDEDMWVPLSKNEDILNGWHANTQIPKFTGFNAVYRYTNNKAYNNAAINFWDIVVKKHTWINGGNSTGEHFFEENLFESKVSQKGGPESCNSVNMMRLTESLYQTDALPQRIDYYERVLYNHILANYDPEQGMCVYYTPMRPGHYKIYGTKYHSFWCCTGTGFEAPAKFAQMIYAHKDNSLYVNLFIPSMLNWKEKGVQIQQSTAFPDENKSVLTLKTLSAQYFNLKIRKPYWAENKDFTVSINGETIETETTNGYITISRKWKNEDKIQISFSPLLKVIPLKNSTRYYAITYGPIVLGTKINNTNIGKEEFRYPRKTIGDIIIPMSEAPVLFGDINSITHNIKRLPTKELMFEYNSPIKDSVILMPFNRIHFSRYAIYMIHINSIQEYKNTVSYGNSYTKSKTEVKGINIDVVDIGDTDSEQMHKMEAVNSFSESYDYTSHLRRAINGGYFMYNLKTLPQNQQYLYVVFRGNDQDTFSFDILVDGHIIKTFTRNKNEKILATQYYIEYIPIPQELTNNKQNITVKISAKLKETTGDILDLRIINK